jgi:hypothetical protein
MGLLTLLLILFLLFALGGKARCPTFGAPLLRV